LSRIQYIRQQVQETTQKRSFRLTVIVLAMLFVLYLVWVLIYRIKRIRHVRAVRAAERERLLQAEAVMKHAEAPRSPGIRFFNAHGVTQPAPSEPEEEAKPAVLPETRPERVAIDIPVDDGPAQDSAPRDNIVSLFPGGKAAEDAGSETPAHDDLPGTETPRVRPAIDIPIDEPASPDDLLAQAVLVAALEPEKAEREETPEEKAERDYFAEFFRPKK
jgi:hypothetical protein